MIRSFKARDASSSGTPLSPGHVPGHGAWLDAAHRGFPA